MTRRLRGTQPAVVFRGVDYPAVVTSTTVLAMEAKAL